MTTYGKMIDNDGTTPAKEEELSAASYQDKLAKAAAKAAEDKAKADAAAAKKAKKKGQAPPAAPPPPALTRTAEETSPPIPTEPPMKVWKEAVIAALAKDPRFTSEAKYLQDQKWVDQTPGSGSDAFADVVGGQLYKQQPGNSDAERAAAHKPLVDSDELYHKYWWAGGAHTPTGMAKDLRGLLDDSAWQPITTVARVMPDGTTASADPYTAFYGVARHKGGMLVVTDPKTGKVVGAGPIDDTNPNAFGGDGTDTGEMSNSLAGQVPGSKAGLELLPDTAGSGVPGCLTNDEWLEAVGYMRKGWKINNRADLLIARAGVAAGSKDRAAALKVLYGLYSVRHGGDTKAVGYADPTTKHEGGGYMNQGSNTVFVGPILAPLARVGDGTSDGLKAVNGALDFYVGGIPTEEPSINALDTPAKQKADLDKWKRQQAAFNPFYDPKHAPTLPLPANNVSAGAKGS
jgi:hypothetical protein